MREHIPFIPYNRELVRLAREHRNNPTPAEKQFWNGLKSSLQFATYKFTRQKPLGEYIADFYCSDVGLVIEIDGDSHAQRSGYDCERTKFMNNLGLTVVRYTNQDVLQDIDSVFANLLNRLNQSPLVSPAETPRAPLIRGD